MNKMLNKLFECALGYHEYTVPDEEYPHILMCKNCVKKGYYNGDDGHEYRCDYDDKGRVTCWIRDTGYKKWYDYDKEGNIIHWRDSYGNESWLSSCDIERHWVYKKPENWVFEKYVK